MSKHVTALPPALGGSTQKHAERSSIPTAWADLNARGREYLLAGDSTRAIECFAKATETNPSYASAWNNHGLALKSKGLIREAVFSYQRAIELEPNFEKAWFNLGSAFHQLGLVEEAIRACDRTIQINPNYLKAWYKKGTCLAVMLRHTEALECFNKVLEIDPKNQEARKRKKESQQAMRRAAKALPSSENSASSAPSLGSVQDDILLAGSESSSKSHSRTTTTSATSSHHFTDELATSSSTSFSELPSSDARVDQLRLNLSSMDLNGLSATSLRQLESAVENFLLSVKYRRMEEEKNVLQSQMCRICQTEPRTMVAMPCMHLCCCASCASKVTKTCPVPECKQKVSRMTKLQ
eukprot:TRINITY_DN181_c0_g1_i2.p1 TRINITY_DN181_c0_g1~~TRINITY_DN181_c0_g1_i2.p1  ORF type:complete len:353 (+),score=52.87 TRINITY_DN181_c0_g1_i2:79-1137(+)